MSSTKCTKGKTELQVTFFVQLIYSIRNVRKSTFIGMTSFLFYMRVECFLCFSKESKTNFPNQFITDLFVALKRYSILSVTEYLLSLFCEIFGQKLLQISSFNGHPRRK